MPKKEKNRLCFKFVKKYNCRKVILNYAQILTVKTKNLIFYDKKKMKFHSNING